jgi:eukaryotic-like serine/threonine-protein kinase
MATVIAAGSSLGRYELLLPIAAGGMGMVWAARLKGVRGFQKVVAVKTLLPATSDDPEFEEMFLSEASLAARIRHPHVVEVLDLGEQGGALYQVMEWIDGEPLLTVMKAAARRGERIPIPVAVRVVMHACAGLQAAHELRDDAGALIGLVHRDVSPQNVLLTRSGIAKVSDFGIAKLTRGGGETAASKLKGKPAYMAPEQVLGRPIDRRVDVFALGVLLYEMTTGKHPFRGDDAVETLANLADVGDQVNIEAPSEMIDGYSPLLSRVVMRALAPNPDDRYESASALVRALDLALTPAMRLSSDQGIADYLEALVGSAMTARAEALAQALREADERSGDGVQFSGALMLESLQNFRPPSETIRAPAAPVAASPPPAPPRRALRIAAIALSCILLGAVVLGVRGAFDGRANAPTPAPASAPTAASDPVPVIATTSGTPAPSAHPSATASASAHPTSPRATRPAPSPKANASGGSPFATPISNPGF